MDYSKFITPELKKEIADRLNSTPNQMNSRTGIVQTPELWAKETDPEALIEGDELIDVKLIDDKWVRVN
jgi:hypothetical protein